jgi:putative phosphoserine phosphatase / 1-acylglycerol-3-phosphate O-acyltransferase
VSVATLPMVTAIDELIARVRSGPQGAHIGAFFDFDGTLVEPAAALAAYRRHGRPCEEAAAAFVRASRGIDRATLDEAGFTALLEKAIAGWAGRTEAEVSDLGEDLFSREVAGALIHGAWRLLRAHQNLGHTVVIVTSGTWAEATPLAQALDVEHVLCTRLQSDDDVLTGRVAGRPLWGAGKLAAVRQFARSHDVDLRLSHVYADGDDDIALLDSVGSPHPVNPAPRLAEHARTRQWQALSFPTRSRRGNPLPVARTTAMFATLLAAGGIGVAAGALRRNPRSGVDLATGLFGRVAPRLGSITIDVTGRHHAWSHRPAVFFVNHQSTLVDVLVTSRVIERGFTIVVKAEVRQMPVIGRLFDLAGVAFLDRSDTSKAISALQPAIDTLRSGTSIALAPEGTRSFTPAVGALKKGGFHLARDAGVPIVPIVIRNAGEIMWRNAMIAQKGTIEVALHQPVPTAGWDRTDIDTWREAMQRLYTDTLDHWPGVAAGQRWSQMIADSITGSR